MKKRIVVIVFALFLVGIAIFVYYGQWRMRHKELYFSGTIEATQANLAFQTSGRVSIVAVQEGQSVVNGQVLAQIDKSELLSRLDQARAIYDKSVKSKKQLETVFDIYLKTLPAEVARAKANVDGLSLIADDARKNYERYEQLYRRGVVSEKERDAVKLNFETAKTRQAEGEAALVQARSNLNKIEATKQDIAAANAQIQAAAASLAQSDIHLQYAKLTAPFAGIITSRNIEPGEVVTPTREVLTLSDLTRVDLKIFVGETEIGKIKPGQHVKVKIDTFPDKVFHGQVSFISQEAEFTPKIIQTRKERVKLVYLVKVSIPNPNLELKPGMPADAWPVD